MTKPSFTKEEYESVLIKKLYELTINRIARLRAMNDADVDVSLTNRIRGQISENKYLLELLCPTATLNGPENVQRRKTRDDLLDAEVSREFNLTASKIKC